MQLFQIPRHALLWRRRPGDLPHRDDHLARLPAQVAVGVYLAVGGALVFATGIALSVYREKLLKLPEQLSKREGVFRILNWR